MRYNTQNHDIQRTFKVWKKRILIGGAIVLGLGIAGCSAGAYGLYVLGREAAEKIDVGALANETPKLESLDLGPISGAVLAIAGDWAAQSIENGDAKSVKEGLACIDSLGGPNAAQVLQNLASKTADAEVSEAMRRVSSELESEGASRKASCVTFFTG